MSLDQATVSRIARLARISVPREDEPSLAAELSQIFNWIEQLGEVDTDDVEPLRSVMELHREWRADVVNDGDRAGDVVANAPAVHDDCFVVPKVIE
ncbi:MAG: Asp-tRNA(Asn)/Glu-tRNA(Gln) amidotransferase subunit GatC [Geminicoccaceae bacterium]|nr:Asp-tRNA(Asn)/Glu-tRNA(Gln) amidotransferase subunit GatC [Geminicoccaceae bacterium]MCB9942037.1 Asp-tRNA(Asn)/Glu-tRNA(Gln) amidotransferase subunit GatC [Geminicoccaceae bacterium]